MKTTIAVALLLASGVALGSALDLISRTDQTTALRAALTQGAQAAVAKLGVTDGFLGNPKVKIALPGKLAKSEKMLRNFGLGPQIDSLTTTMNRAAEAAVPEARVLLVDAVKQMSVQDVAGILNGGPDSATQYFRGKTSESLTARFLPIVRTQTAKLDLASRYNAVAGKAAAFGLVDAKDSSVENYVTQKALEGLFTMIAEEEAAIRANPLGQASKLLQKVFSAAGQ
ncbi:MAG: DUF4197 domain-containing protein [Steroidobacteraceae bacterium]